MGENKIKQLLTSVQKPGSLVLLAVLLFGSIFPQSFALPVKTAEAATGVPLQINFQGRLTLATGAVGTNVANGTYAMRFKLYDALTSGTLLWTETYDQAPVDPCQKVQVTAGVFNVKLGSCATLSGVDFTSDSLYLSVDFAPTGTSYDGEMSPRKRLVSAPYAINANNLAGNGKIDLTNTATTTTPFKLTANTLTTGSGLTLTTTTNSAANTAWTGATLTFNNAQASTAVSSGSIAGLDIQFNQNTAIAGNTETAARINVKQNDSSSTDATVASLLDLANNDTATGNQITVSDALKITGSNVTNGINLSGTFASNLITSTNFTVAQSGQITSANLGGSGTQCLQASNTGVISGTGGACGGTTTLQSAYGNDVDGSDTTISLTTADDSVIITNPSSSGTDSTFVLKVDQAASGAVDSLIVNNAGTGTLATLDASNASGNGVSIDVQSSSSSQYALKVTSNNGSTNGLYVRADGNVGIGTTSPTQKLYVAGDALIGNTGTGKLYFDDTNGWIARTAAGNTLQFSPSGNATSMSLTSSRLHVGSDPATTGYTANFFVIGANAGSGGAQQTIWFGASARGGNTGSGHNTVLSGGAGSTATTGSIGGNVNIYGGNANGTGDNNGGSIYLDGGTATGTGTAGNILLASTTGKVGIGTSSPSALLHVQKDNIGSTSTDGEALVNSTAAGVGAQQFSPRLRFTGQGWKTNATAASQTVDWAIENQPVQGAANPSTNLSFNYQINGGGYSNILTLTSGGVIGTDAVSTANASFGVINSSALRTGMKISSDDIYFTQNSSDKLRLLNGIGIRTRSDNYFGWSSGADVSSATDLFLRRNAAANLALGAVDAASPVAQTISVQNVSTGTSDTAGAALSIAGSQGTGTGVGGSILFKTAPAGSTGSSQNALTTAMTILGSGKIGIGTTTPSDLLDVNGAINSTALTISQTSPSSTNRYIIGNSNGFALRSNISYGWGSGSGDAGGSKDTGISRGAANTVYIGNGTGGDSSGTLVATNIGIGSTSPGSNLDIDRADASSITAEQILFRSNNTAQTLTDGTTITNWRNNQFLAPTINGVAGGGTETVTNAATLYVDNAPAGSNITITNPYALWVDEGAARFDRESIGTTSTDGIILQNSTAAGAGAQQYSPRIRLTGQGWKTDATAASQTVDWIMEARPVQGAANPTVNLAILAQVNGGGYTSAIAPGQILAPGGASTSQAAPQYSAINNSAYGLKIGGGNAGNAVALVGNNTSYLNIDANVNAIGIKSNATLRWGAENFGTTQVSLSSPSNDNLLLRDSSVTGPGNFIIGSTSTLPGTSGKGVLVVGLGTVPTSSPADIFQIYAADYAAGDTRAFLRTESGTAQIIGNNSIGTAPSTGTDTAGTNFSLFGGQGTGTGIGGNVVLQAAYPSTTGSTANSLTDVFTILASNKATSGTQNLVSITPTVNQSSTAAYNALLVNVTETATGSGAKNLLKLQVGGTDKFNVSNSGVITSSSLAGGGTLCLQTDNNGVISPAASACGSASTTLQSAYGNDVDGSDATISLTTADDSIIVTNPSSSGTDSTFTFKINQAASGAVDALIIDNAGTGTLGTFDASNASGNGISIDVQSSSASQYGLRVTANNGATNALWVGGDGRVGIGDVNPASLFTVGSGDLFQINTTGQIGSQQAPLSDYLFALAGTTGNDNSRIIDITQENDEVEDSTVINIVNTANAGTIASGATRNIKNIYTSLTPTITFSTTGVQASANIYGADNNVSLANVSIPNVPTSRSRTVNSYGSSSTVSAGITLNDTNGGSTITLNTYGTYGAVTASPTLTALSTSTNATYAAGYFNNTLSSAGNAFFNPGAFGIIAITNGNLTTTGGTSHTGGYFDVGGTAVNNYGIQINSVTAATNNYGLYMDSIASAASNYAIYSNAAAQSYFAGNIGIGTTVPDSQLHIGATTGSLTTSTSINISKINFASASTIAGSGAQIYGQFIDMSNITGAADTAVVASAKYLLPSQTNSTINAYNYVGATVSGGTLTMNNASGALNYTGFQNTSPAIVGTNGSVIANGFKTTNGTVTTTGTQAGLDITTSTITTAGNQYGVNVNAVGIGAGTLNALKISNITAGAGTENAIQIGTGWDKQINGNGWNVDGSGNLTVTSCTGCGGGSGSLDSITAATADDTNNDNTNKQIAWDWSTPTTQTAFKLQNTGTGLTSGSIFNVSSATTSTVATNGIVSLNASGNYTSTSNVGLLQVAANATTAGTVAKFSGTALTTGTGVFMQGGTAMTTGSVLQLASTTYNHGNATETGNLLNIAFTDATNGTATSTTNGINITPTINVTTGASGAKTINGIKISAPTLTACTGGSTCTYAGLNVDTSGTLANTTIYSALFSGGNVGIGTTAPTQILHVQNGSEFINLTSSFTPTTLAGGFDTSGQNINTVFVAGKYAFIGQSTNAGTCSGTTVTGCEFSIWDIHNPNNPLAVSGVNIASTVKTIYVSGKYAVIGRIADAGTCTTSTITGCELMIYDITNPNSPSLLSVDGGFNQDINSLFIQGKLLFVASNTDNSTGTELKIYDLSNPTTLAVIGSINTADATSGEGAIKSVYVQGRYMYLGLSSTTGTGCTSGDATSCDFRIYDINDPFNPTFKGGTNPGTDVNAVSANGKYAYAGFASVSGNDFQIYNIADPTAPTATAGSDLSTGVLTLQIQGKYAYIGKTSASGNDFQILDITDPTATPVNAGGSDITFDVKSVFISGKYAYIGIANTADTAKELRVLDIAGVDTPTITTGNAGIGNLQVTDNARIDSDLHVAGSINVGLGGIQSSGPISIENTLQGNSSGNGVAGIYGNYTFNNTTSSVFQYGNRFISNITAVEDSNVDSTYIGQLIRIVDTDCDTGATTLDCDNTVRGLEVQSWTGNNTAGTNTAIAGFGKTFGLQGTTDALAGGVSQPAAVFADLDNGSAATVGNAIRAYTDNATSADLVSFYQETTAYTGTGLLMNFGNNSGSYSGNFIDLQKAGSSKWKINYDGTKITQTISPTGSIIDFASATNGNTFIWKVPQKATTGTCATATAEGMIFQNTGGTQVGHICIDGPTSGTPNKLRFYAEQFNATSTDLAENYSDVAGKLTPGDVVSFDLNQDKAIVQANAENSENLAGIISTAPGLLLTDASEDGTPSELVNPKPLAISGRVPVKVTDENGIVKKGDYLTLSLTKPGFAMKATKAGTVLGQAISDSKDGYATVFVNLTTWNGKKSGLPKQKSLTGEVKIPTDLLKELSEDNSDYLSEIFTDRVVARDVVSDTISTNTLSVASLKFIEKDGLSLDNAFIMKGGLKVDSITSITDLIKINSDVEFIGTPFFNKDTAGFARIIAGTKEIRVEFEKEYLVKPIVTANLSFERDENTREDDQIKNEELDVQAAFSGVQFVIINKNTRGFTILLNKKAPRDLSFSWIALAVKDATTYVSKDLTAEEKAQEQALEQTQDKQTVNTNEDIQTDTTQITNENPDQNEKTKVETKEESETTKQ